MIKQHRKPVEGPPQMSISDSISPYPVANGGGGGTLLSSSASQLLNWLLAMEKADCSSLRKREA